MQSGHIRRLKAGWLGAVFFLFSALANAEILHNVYPYESLKSIKEKYPSATFQKEKVQTGISSESVDHWKMYGEGFPGALHITFDDGRPAARSIAAVMCKEPIPNSMSDMCKTNQGLLLQSDEVALKVKSVRWVPDQLIPFAGYRTKYGAPSKMDSPGTDKASYAEWTKLGLRARLTDDKKFIESLETDFTVPEKRASFLRINGYIPENLKDPGPAPVANPAPAASSPSPKPPARTVKKKAP